MTQNSSIAPCRHFRSLNPHLLLIIVGLGLSGCGRSAPDDSSQMHDSLRRLGATLVFQHGRLDTVSFQNTSASDDDVAVLQGQADLRQLELRGTVITDDAIRRVAGLPTLRILDLSDTQISDDGLILLSTFPKLEVLRLVGTVVSDEGMKYLHRIKTLRMVDASNTQVTLAGVSALKSAIPECQVIVDINSPASSPATENVLAADLNHSRSPEPDRSIPSRSFETVKNTDESPTAEPEKSQRQLLGSDSVVTTSHPNDRLEAADPTQNTEVAWTSRFGGGGAVLPRLRSFAKPVSATGSQPFNRVVGAVFQDDRDEIVFIGDAEPGWPAISPDDLLDGLAVALQSQLSGKSPGVTFEPTPGQLARGHREDDLLNVEYFGTAEGTIVGLAAFEADRMMKSLSSGRDNISKEFVGSKVPGFLNEIERKFATALPTRRKAWHRFWIEPASTEVQRTDDGRSFLVEVNMAVHTRYMTVRAGELVDSKDAADPAAQGFADHMTQHYKEFARETPAFAQVYNFAALSSLAEAVLATQKTGTGPLGDVMEWLAEHQPRDVETPVQTPVTVVEERRRIGNRERVLQLAGGVTLNPGNQYRSNDTTLPELSGLVIQTRPPGPQLRNWGVRHNANTYTASASRARRRRRVWQTDLQDGRLSLVRELITQTDNAGQSVDSWRVRLPRLEMEGPDGEGAAEWKTVSVQDAQGFWHAMSRGEIRLPIAEEKTPAYIDSQGHRYLALYSNKWIYVEEPVAYKSTENGPVHPVPEGDGRLIEFSATHPHHVARVLTAQGMIEYTHDGERLTEISNGADSLRLTYDGQNRLDSVEASDDRVVSYRYRDDSQLVDVVHDGEVTSSYDYDAQHQLADVTLPTDAQIETSGGRTVQIGFRPRPSLAEQLAAERRAAESGLTVVSISSSGPNTHQLRINGQENPIFDGKLSDVLGESGGNDAADTVMQTLRDLRKSATLEARPIVITGNWQNRGRLRRTLRREFDDAVVTTTANLSQAQDNLSGPGVASGESRLIVGDGLSERVRPKLEKLSAGDKSAPVIIFSAHNDTSRFNVGETGERLLSLIESGEARGKFVILNTCGGGNLDFLANELIATGGAIGVVGFLKPIPQQKVAPLAENIQREVHSHPGQLDHAELQRIIEDSIRALQNNLPATSTSSETDLPAGSNDVVIPGKGTPPSLDFWYLQTQTKPCPELNESNSFRDSICHRILVA